MSRAEDSALEEFRRRQKLHRDAEVQTMLDVGEFIRKAHVIYGYEHFVNDSSGSICELNDNRVLEHLYKHTLIVYLSAKEELETKINPSTGKTSKTAFL